MLALTLWPEWAWCICYLGKRIENRTWLPRPEQLRPGDRFAIHAGAEGRGRDWRKRLRLAAATAEEALHRRGEVCTVNARWGTNLVLDGLVLPNPLRAVVAVATYTGQARSHPADPWVAEGQLQWGLGDVNVLSRPVPCRGAQGLWRLPEDVEREVLAQVGGA
jgi:hypothetical protein